MSTKTSTHDDNETPPLVSVWFSATAALITLLAGIAVGRYLLPVKARTTIKQRCPACVVRYRVAPSPSSPTLGSDEAPVTALLITNLTCPKCRSLTHKLERIQKKHSKIMRLALIVDPRGPGAGLVAKAIQAANAQGKAWMFHDALLTHKGPMTMKVLQEIAAKTGLNLDRFRHDMTSKATAHLVDSDARTLARLGIESPPKLFFNGRLVSADVSEDKLADIVDQERATMDALIAQIRAQKPSVTAYQAVILARKKQADAALPSLGGQKGKIPSSAKEDPNAVYRVTLTDKPFDGPPDALVTVVLFSNFHTPFGKTADKYVSRLRSMAPRDIRIVWHDNPLPQHHRAELAAQACREVYEQKGSRAFWAYQTAVMKARLEFVRNPDPLAVLRREAEKLGLDMQQFERALKTDKHRSFLENERTEAMNLGALGMVTFFVNGRKIRGLPTYDKLKDLVRRELERAKKAVAGGKVTRAGYYDAITAKGYRKVHFLSRHRTTVHRRVLASDVVFKMPARGKPWKGSRSPLVTIVVSSDFQCPFSRRLAAQLDAVVSAHPKDVRVVWHNNPLPMHRYAAIAAEAAWDVFLQKGNAAFWRYHDLLFANQRRLIQEGPAFLEETARRLGINMQRFEKALNKRIHRTTIERQRRKANRLGAISTPTLFINGRAMVGARPLSEIERRISKELSRMEPLAQKAGGRLRLYDTLMSRAVDHAVYQERPVDQRKSSVRRTALKRKSAP